MSSKEVFLNSPIVHESARKAGLSTNAFVEMCTLQIIRIMQENPEEFMQPGDTPAERLHMLRNAVEFYETYKKQNPETRAAIRKQLPEIDFSNLEK